MLYPAELRDQSKRSLRRPRIAKGCLALSERPAKLATAEGSHAVNPRIAKGCLAYSEGLSKLAKSIKKKPPPATDGGLSGWQDSNLRPPGPKPGAITGLRYTPNFFLRISRFIRNSFIAKEGAKIKNSFKSTIEFKNSLFFLRCDKRFC